MRGVRHACLVCLYFGACFAVLHYVSVFSSARRLLRAIPSVPAEPAPDNNFAVVTVMLGGNTEARDLVAVNVRCLASIGRRLPPNLKRVCLYDDRLDVPRIEGWQLLAVAPIAAPHGDLSNHYTRAGVYTKLHVWNLTSYSAVLYLDLDTLPMRSVYPVFSQQLPAMLAAHQTVGMALDSLAPFDAHSFNAGSYSLPDASPLCAYP